MFDIAKYLEKFKNIGHSRDFLRNSVVEAIKTICNIKIDVENIDIKDGLVRIHEKPIVKTEIFIKKQKILEEIQKTTKNKVFDLI